MELAIAFFVRYYQKTKLSETAMDLLNVRQKKGEPFLDFITRFTTENLRLGCTTEELICPTFQNGLFARTLYAELG